MLKLFNIDLHISVIADIKKIFTDLGHQVVDKSLSGHTFVFNRQKDNLEVINDSNWRNLSKKTCDDFYERYKNDLNSYDGFICAYPPSFALLYEKFNKPIILQVPIRFEVPFQNNPNALKWFVDFLKSGIDNRQIIPVCNSLYEKKYCEEYTDREWKLIPNICEYTGIKYEGGADYLLYCRKKIEIKSSLVKDKDRYLGNNYRWSSLNKIKGIIHLPYNISTMSIYEQYTGNIPLLFPSLDFNMQLYKQGFTLSELSWNDKKKDSKEWIGLADYYNDEWMKYITYFSSFDELWSIIENMDVKGISGQMKSFNVERKQKIYDLWRKICENIDLR